MGNNNSVNRSSEPESPQRDSSQHGLEELTMDRERRITPGSIMVVRTSNGNIRTITVGREIYNPTDPRIIAVTFYGPDLPIMPGDEINRGDAGDLDDMYSDHEEEEYDEIPDDEDLHTHPNPVAAARPPPPTTPAPKPRGKALPPSRGAPLTGPCIRCRKMKKRCDWDEGRPCVRCRKAGFFAHECVQAGQATRSRPKNTNDKRDGGGDGADPSGEEKRGSDGPPNLGVPATPYVGYHWDIKG
ncbi:hypothetical protein AC579_10196 [Pseudocercospora musae]|uniref:Zn(2)-C6 fungal-type domain-containing protein n=1 Tax=Pseudocercospora musae TaxID=113226 RepID=A0A139I313_9PEZI|nr:hypothetical protein AC579_10196 [Pseudocercospora musae]